MMEGALTGSSDPHHSKSPQEAPTLPGGFVHFMGRQARTKTMLYFNVQPQITANDFRARLRFVRLARERTLN
jgi:hypothetical protein